MRFTVLGSSGFIGSHLVKYLKSEGRDCFTPGRQDANIFKEDLGHVIYCIGFTGDFLQKPFDTVKAHVCHLSEILERAKFESFLYLSSTRVYSGLTAGLEDSCLKVNPQEPDHLYNLSKLMGESVCLFLNRPGIRVARLSNIYGFDPSSSNFLNSIIRDSVDKNKIVFRTSLSSERDFLGVNDVVKILPVISLRGRHRVYNVASGKNVNNKALADRLKQLTGCSVEVDKGAPRVRMPRISIRRIKKEFGFKRLSVLDSLKELVLTYEREGKPL